MHWIKKAVETKDRNRLESCSRAPAIGTRSVAIICFSVVLTCCILILSYLWKTSSLVGVEVTTLTELFDNTEFMRQVSNLELVSRTTNEVIEETQQIKIILPWIGPVKSEAEYRISFKVRYVYHVPSERGRWYFKFEDGIAHVKAPALTPGEPSIYTDSIRASREGGMLVFNKEKHLDTLKKNISSYAREKASQKQSKDIVREHARASLEKFIYEWFLKDNPDVKGIKVTFDDEGAAEQEGLPRAL
ncbi:MAG: hypothetical protein JW808_00235 [Victivallales bacterium]|nr:hypothetical protein [Victivallales bacterium]